MHKNIYLHFFAEEADFPFFIQYGQHDKEMYVHTHADFSELVIILEGTATHIVNGEEYPIKKGDVFVINDNTSHGYKNAHHFRICNIMFRPDFFLSAQSDIKTSPGFHALFVIEPFMTRQRGLHGHLTLKREQFEEINHLMKEMNQEFTSQPAGYQTMIHSLLVQMITKLSRLYVPKDVQTQNDSLSLAGSVAYMENHFQDPLSIDTLAEIAGMSDRHFRRLFQHVYGTSPLKYMNALRIQTAIRLLTDTEYPVTEIALRCGFSDSNYFSSRFKQATGKSPLEYRKYTHTPYLQ